MQINPISGNFPVQTRDSLLRTERTSTRVTEIGVGNRPETPNTIESKSDTFSSQKELFATLTSKLEEKNSTSIQISFNINVIKANLGSLLSGAINRSDSNTLTNLFSDNRISLDNSQSNPATRERYINALITTGIGGSGLFNSTGTLSTSPVTNSALNPFAINQTDGNQLLLNLLVGELETPQDDAIKLLNALLNETFQTVA